MVSSPSFFAPLTSLSSRSGPSDRAIFSTLWACAVTAAQSSHGNKDFKNTSVALPLYGLSPEEEFRPELIPFPRFVQHDHRVDHLVGKLVQVGFHRGAGRHAVAL